MSLPQSLKSAWPADCPFQVRRRKLTYARTAFKQLDLSARLYHFGTEGFYHQYDHLHHTLRLVLHDLVEILGSAEHSASYLQVDTKPTRHRDFRFVTRQNSIRTMSKIRLLLL